MKLYSNILLSWPQTLHLFQIARFYPGQWYNYHFYKISNIDPFFLVSHSPIQFLENNYKYYCYNKIYRNKQSEIFGNSFQIINISNNETWGYIPKNAEINDMIVIKKENTNNMNPFINISFIPAI
jgi:hypothetical protein